MGFRTDKGQVQVLLLALLILLLAVQLLLGYTMPKVARGAYYSQGCWYSASFASSFGATGGSA